MVNGDAQLLTILFAGTLIAGTLIVLLSPVIYKLTEETTKFRLYALMALVIGVMGLSVYVVFLAITNPIFFLPFVILVGILRAASPTFLYRGLEDRFELRKWWVFLKALLALAFLGYAGYIVYTILLDQLANLGLVGPRPTEAILGENVLMAIGGAFVIIRVLSRILPESLRDKPTVWITAILLSVAFALLAPFAFPEYDLAYRLSGLAGWAIGFLVLWRFS